jgi:hypothetical protein
MIATLASKKIFKKGNINYNPLPPSPLPKLDLNIVHALNAIHH